MNSVALELKKLRRTQYLPIAIATLAFQWLWLGATMFRRAASGQAGRLLGLSLNEAVSLATLMAPIISALLASRLVTVDTVGRMGQFFGALGQRSSARFLGKLAVAGTTVALVEVATLLLVAVAGPAIGLGATEHYRVALPLSLVVMVAASFAAVAAQLVLSTRLDKQGVAVGIATLVAIFASGLGFVGVQALAWALPWTVAVAANTIDQARSQQQGGDIALVGSPAMQAGFAVLAALAWIALAHLVIVGTERRS